MTPEQRREIHRQRYASDPEYRERMLAAIRRYAKTPKELAHRHNVKRRGVSAIGYVPRDVHEHLLNAWGRRCVFCRCDLGLDTVTIDHFVPVSKGGSHTLENLLPACGPCNSSKGAGPWPKRIARRAPQFWLKAWNEGVRRATDSVETLH